MFSSCITRKKPSASTGKSTSQDQYITTLSPCISAAAAAIKKAPASCGYKNTSPNSRKLKREIGGKIKTLTVRRDALDDFWLCSVTDEDIEPIEARSGESAGLDFGLETFLFSRGSMSRK
jgi:hypothetical protein